MNITRITETLLTAVAVIGIIAVLPFAGVIAAALLIAGGLATMAVLEARERSF